VFPSSSGAKSRTPFALPSMNVPLQWPASPVFPQDSARARVGDQRVRHPGRVEAVTAALPGEALRVVHDVDAPALRVRDRIGERHLAPLAHEVQLRRGRHLVDDLGDRCPVVVVEREPAAAEVARHHAGGEVSRCLRRRKPLEAGVDDGDLCARPELAERLPRGRVRPRNALACDGEVNGAERRADADDTRVERDPRELTRGDERLDAAGRRRLDRPAGALDGGAHGRRTVGRA
jgi:hypothetical protein